jgi:hypothetical protein
MIKGKIKHEQFSSMAQDSPLPAVACRIPEPLSYRCKQLLKILNIFKLVLLGTMQLTLQTVAFSEYATASSYATPIKAGGQVGWMRDQGDASEQDFGYHLKTNLKAQEDQIGEHNEASWRRHIGEAPKWLVRGRPIVATSAPLKTLLSTPKTERKKRADTFYKYCTDPTLSPARRLTVGVMLYRAGTVINPQATWSEEICRVGTEWLHDTVSLNLFRYQSDPAWEPLSDLTPLDSLTQLRFLTFSRNAVTDLTPLSALINIEVLNGYDNQISVLTPLAGMTKMFELILANNQIEDLTPIAGMRGLSTLNITNNKVTDLTPLKQLRFLEWLNAGNNEIKSLEPLEMTTRLRGLIVENNQLTTLQPLKNLANLEHVVVSGNAVQDLSPLVSATKLEVLGAANCGLSLIDSLSSNAYLRWLDLQNNSLDSVDALQDLFDMKFLYLTNNKLCSLPENLLDLQVSHRSSQGEWISLKITGQNTQDQSACL